MNNLEFVTRLLYFNKYYHFKMKIYSDSECICLKFICSILKHLTCYKI